MARKTLTTELNESWNFEQNKELHGILVDKRENVGKNNSKLFTIEVSGKKGEKVAVWGSTKLDDLWQLQVGTEVWIEYLGQEKSKNGRMFKNYKIDFDDSTVPASDQDIKDILDSK